MTSLRTVRQLSLSLTLLTVAAAPALQERGLETVDLAALQLRSIGPATMSGRIVDVAVVESDPYVFYVASATGGVWKTVNNGVTFTPVFEREATHSVGAVAVDQGNPDVVWVGTGERANRQSSSWGDGVYRSTDAGKSWTNVGLRDSRHIGRIAVHPRDGSIVFVAAMGSLFASSAERGLYRSADGGETWTCVLAIDDDTGVVDVAIDPEDAEIVYAAAYQRRRTAFGFDGGGPGSGLYRSGDGGNTWTELTGASLDAAAAANADHPEGTLVNGLPAGEYGRIGISIHRRDPRIVYVAIEQGLRYSASTTYEDERYAGVYRSDDRGLTWQHMSDWNPRPMYASQILVDPGDDQRIYQENSFSYSDDGGRTWTVPSQSVHSDDRFLWVDPRDSRHLIKASDGALAISYDRARTWLWASNLPVSQYYRVRVDMADPYNVYGGLQDNGTWVGPSATYRSEGILNDDWRPIGGGDGFLALPDPENADTVYVESQYLGLERLHVPTGERQSIRPANPQGYRGVRRIWRLFGSGEEPTLLEQEMEPANWDGAYTLSPHDPDTVYAGTSNLWVSRDRGGKWTDLGRMSDVWERSEIDIMGQAPATRSVSLDDGVPYFATVTTIAESPRLAGLLWVGTDDGRVRVSRDGGATWSDVHERIPGLPPRTWVADLEPSAHDDDTVLAAFQGYRQGDDANYLFRSDDGGASWRDIAGDLPSGLTLRAVQQDAVNPHLFYLGTEFGLFISIDDGAHWVELGAAMPTVPTNDFTIHARDGDLIVGTHGRGVWILDSIASLRGLTPEVVSTPVHLFAPRDARMVRRARSTGSMGDTQFRGQNPAIGALIDYWLAEAISVAEGDAVPLTLSVHDGDGNLVRTLEPTLQRGVNRVVWDLRHASLPTAENAPEPPDPVRADTREGRGSGRAPAGPLVVPGTYTIRLGLDETTLQQTVQVHEDPRLRVAPAVRAAWTLVQLQLGETYSQANELAATLITREKELAPTPGGLAASAGALRAEVTELRGRVLGLRASVAGWTGEPTSDQRSEMMFYRRAMQQLQSRAEAYLAIED